MMTLILLIIGLIVPISLGIVVVERIFKSKLPPLSESLAFAFFMGSALLTMLLFVLSLLSIPWGVNLVRVISVCAIFGALAIFFRRRKKLSILAAVRGLTLSSKEWMLLFFIFVNAAVICYLAVNKPVVNWDAWANWSLRAKVFYFEKGIPINPSHPYFLGRGGHVNYPLHIPLFEAWIYLVIGQWNDQAVKIIFPLYTAFFALFVYTLVNRIAGRTSGLLFCLLFTLMPFVAYHSFSEYADLPTGLYLGLAGASAWIFIQTKKEGYLLASSLLLGMSGWVKNEGLVLGAAATGIFLIYFKKKIAKILLPTVGFLAPWLLFRQYYNLGISNLTPKPDFGTIAFHQEAISVLANEIWRVENFGLLWIAFIFIIIFKRSVIKKLQLTMFIILVVALLLVYFGIYLFTDNAQFVLSGIVVNRNLLTVVPTLFWLTALVFARPSDLTSFKKTFFILKKQAKRL